MVSLKQHQRVKKNIEASAWGAKFPWQVKVKRIKDYKPIPKISFEGTINFKWRYPQPVITYNQILLLRQFFEKAESLPSSEKKFRDAFQAKFRAGDGHWVRSHGELHIDNWLFQLGIYHGYERKVPVVEGLYCDFFIPLPDKRKYVYIEYLGKGR